VDAAARRALEKIGAERAALGLPPQQNAPSGGFSNLTWSKPVGDATLLGHAPAHASGIRCNWSK
jgi:hypothetical protein